MKIVNKKNFSICFGDIGCGEVFEYDSIYWMKVYHDPSNKYYAVCMGDGEICEEFEFADMCRVVRTELHILD
jgi:hypothetical protein